MDHVEPLCDQRLSSGWQQRALRLTEDQRQLQQQEQQMAQAAAIAAGAKPAEVAGAATASNTAATASDVVQQKRSECSVYLASDEPNVATEIRQKYKHIHVITNGNGLQTSECYLCVSSFVTVHGIMLGFLRGVVESVHTAPAAVMLNIILYGMEHENHVMASALRKAQHALRHAHHRRAAAPATTSHTRSVHS
jgi:hypothetical protein